MELPGLSPEEVKKSTPVWNKEVTGQLTEFLQLATEAGLSSDSPEKDNRFSTHCRKHPNQDHQSVLNGVIKIYNRYYSAALRHGGWNENGEYLTKLAPIFDRVEYSAPL